MSILYSDGGCINRNPSPYGGTWAYVLVDDDDETIIQTAHGYVPRSHMDGDVTNNQMEFHAIIHGLLRIPNPENLKEVRSDSNITLGRIFKDWSITNIPDWILEERKLALKRYKTRNWTNMLMLKYTLLDGHPTQAQLEAGIGKREHPVSKWNVLCDKLCNDEAQEFLQNLGE